MIVRLTDPARKAVTPAEIFSQGMDWVARGFHLEAMKCFEAAHQLQPDNPIFASFFGLTLAEQRGLFRRALDLCHQAIKLSPENGTLHLNLARALLANDQKPEAMAALREGIIVVKDPGPLQTLLDQIGCRRDPLFGSLPRSHPLNKYLGMLTFRLGLR